MVLVEIVGRAVPFPSVAECERCELHLSVHHVIRTDERIAAAQSHIPDFLERLVAIRSGDIVPCLAYFLEVSYVLVSYLEVAAQPGQSAVI